MVKWLEKHDGKAPYVVFVLLVLAGLLILPVRSQEVGDVDLRAMILKITALIEDLRNIRFIRDDSSDGVLMLHFLGTSV